MKLASSYPEPERRIALQRRGNQIIPKRLTSATVFAKERNRLTINTNVGKRNRFNKDYRLFISEIVLLGFPTDAEAEAAW